jgi:hypothetical protein
MDDDPAISRDILWKQLSEESASLRAVREISGLFQWRPVTGSE